MNDELGRWLDSCPRRVLDWREAPEGRAVILRPRFGCGAWGRQLKRLLRASDYRIRLDDVGTLVWKSLDGRTPLSDVAVRLREEFGGRVEPAEPRLLQFVRQMAQSRLIEF